MACAIAITAETRLRRVQYLSAPVQHGAVHQYERSDMRVIGSRLGRRKRSQGRAVAQCRRQFLGLTGVEVLAGGLAHENRAGDPLRGSL